MLELPSPTGILLLGTARRLLLTRVLVLAGGAAAGSGLFSGCDRSSSGLEVGELEFSPETARGSRARRARKADRAEPGAPPGISTSELAGGLLTGRGWLMA